MCTNTTDNWPQVEAQSKLVLPDPIVKYIEDCRQKPEPASYLISVLHKVQGHFGFLGNEQMDAVAQLLGVPASKVTGVATFYHFFRLKPRGRYIISVCMGTACYVKGATEIAARVKEELSIDFGETSKDGIFSLEMSRCLGTCGLAPVVMINDEVHGKLKPDQIPALLEKYREKARADSK
jgi:NADH:ubiquinone oxidoreductase subunit E